MSGPTDWILRYIKTTFTFTFDIMDGDGGNKRSDERPKTIRSMYPRKAVDVNLKTDPNIEAKVEQIELHSGCVLGENA